MKETVKKKRKPMNPYKKDQLLFIWPLLTIPILAWLTFFLYVNLSSFVQAFQDATGKLSLINFQEAWNSILGKTGTTDTLSVAIRNTILYFILSELVIFPVRIVMSYFLYKQIAGFKVFRIVFYLPAIISAVTMTGVFQEFIAPGGPLDVILEKVGVSVPLQGFLGTRETATPTIMAYCLWSGLTTHLLICGAMAKIPVEVLESARLDGIKSGRELISIVVPLIWPTISTLVILSLTGILGASGPILLLSPDPWTLKTYTVSYWLWEKVYSGGNFMQGKYSLVSAVGLIFTVFTVPIVLLLRWIVEKIPTAEY